MKKIGIFLLIMCYLVGLSPAYARASSVESTEESTVAIESVTNGNSAIAMGSYSLDALNPLLGADKLVDNARSAIVYESNSQTLLYAWNPDVQMYPASLVKILTALIAIEKGTLTDVVTVSQTAIGSIPQDAVSAKLLSGEKVSLEELLYCLLLGSANDAAAVIAEHIAGSQSEFVSLMNQYALDLGCTSTRFTNPHGLHDDNQHTTARDCAKILDAALKNEVFKTIFTADNYTVKATNLSAERLLTSGNSMKDASSKLYYDSRVIGGRTGVTSDGRRCLAAAAENNGMLVVSVVMGAESVYQDDGYSAISIGGYRETSKLFDACLTGYKTTQLIHADQVLRQIPVNGATNDLVIGPQLSVSTVLPEEITVSDLSFQYTDQSLKLPIQKGQYVSDLKIWHGDMCVAQAQLYAMNSVSADIENAIDGSGTGSTLSVAVWIIIGVIGLAIAVYLSLHFSSIIKRFFVRIRRRRYRNNRKRVR